MASYDKVGVLADITRQHAIATPDKVALIADKQQWTYAELDAEACRVAQAFLALGIDEGDRIAFLDRNTPQYFTQLFGGAKVNAVSVAVNWRLAPPEMEFILNNADAKILFVGAEFLGHLAKMTLTTVETIVVIGEPGESGYPSYQDWLVGNEPVDPMLPATPETTCYQLYTSGTTGLPKGVELTNRNFMTCMAVGADEWCFNQDSVNLVAMPLFHIAGSGWGIAGMAQGGTAILMRDIDPVGVLKLIERYKITTALLVPAVLQFCLTVPSEGIDLSSMQTMVYGASPITEQVLVGAMKLFDCDFMQAYGLTETTGGIVILRPEDHDPGGEKRHLLRAAGALWGDVELRIVDTATGTDLADGEVGEVWCRSAQVMKGYWKNEEATKAAITPDGWFKTGDAGYLREGYLYIHDRVKDMVVSGGENIYPAEIENALMKHPLIADIAVIGVPDEKWGESVKAIITRTSNDLTEADVFAYARENLAHYKCPTTIDWIEALPRNPSGKVLKTELRKPYWEGQERMVR